jgi:hypothetical protein
MTSAVNPFGREATSGRASSPWEETEPVRATVSHADIRGLGTTLLVSVGCLPRSRHEHLHQAHNAVEGCTVNRGCVSSDELVPSLKTLFVFRSG